MRRKIQTRAVGVVLFYSFFQLLNWFEETAGKRERLQKLFCSLMKEGDFFFVMGGSM